MNIESSPAIADNKIYVGGWDSFVYCFVASAPKVSTTIKCSASTTSVAMGNSLTVSGSITPAVSGATVTLTYTKPDATTLTRTVTSLADGSFSDTYMPDAAGEWSVESSWQGDAGHTGATSTAAAFTITAEGIVSTTISCAVSSTSVAKGNSLTVSGSISPAVSGATVTLTYTKPDATTLTRTVTSLADGSFSDTYMPDAAGEWSVESSWQGDAGHTGATSTANVFTVTEAQAPASGIPTEYVYAGIATVAIAVVAVAAYLRMKRGKKVNKTSLSHFLFLRIKLLRGGAAKQRARHESGRPAISFLLGILHVQLVIRHNLGNKPHYLANEHILLYLEYLLWLFSAFNGHR